MADSQSYQNPTQHTPGPWTYIEGDRIAAPCHEHPNCEKTIAWAGRGHYGQQGVLQCSVGNNEDANARLIAAAPDLLAVLKAFIEDERFQIAIGGNPNAVRALMAAATAAIAKAEVR